MDRPQLIAALGCTLALACGSAAPRAGTGVPMSHPGDAAPTGLARSRVAATGVLTYDAAYDGDELVSVELRERFELVVRGADARERLRVDLGAAEYDVVDLAVADTRAWVASIDGTARGIDLATGAVVATWHLGDRATAIAASADGRFVVTGTASGVMCLRRRADAALLQCVVAHDGRISALAITVDSATVVSSGWDGRVIEWSLPALAVRASVELAGSANDVAVSPHGEIAIATSPAPPVRTPLVAERERRGQFDGPGDVVVWQPGTEPRHCPGHRAPVTTIAWVGPQRAVSGSWDRTLRLWDTKTCASLARLRGFTGPVQSVRAKSARIAASAWPGGLEGASTVVIDLLYSRERVDIRRSD